jgi:TolA-binding protein
MSDLVKGELLARIRSNRRLYEDVPSERGLYYYALFFETDRGLMPQGFNLDDNLIGPIAILDPQARITRNNNQEKRQPNLGKENGVVTQPNAKNNPAGENRIKPGDLNQNNGQLATNLLNNQPNNISSQKRMTSINDVINQTYSKGAYKAAIKTLQKYLNDKNDSSRAKALFYTGLSYYRLNSFEKALDYFVHPLTVKAYGKRAEFWYRQTLENLP